MLCKRTFIYTHCFGLYEYSCLYSFETLYLFNSKGQCFRREKLMQGKWVNYSSKNKYCFETPFYTCVFNIYINEPLVGPCVPTMGSYHQKEKSKSLCLLLFSHSEREKNLKRENAYPWALKMNYFGICIGSMRLSTLELPNFLPQYSTSTHQHDGRPNSLRSHLFVSKNWTVFRESLFHKNNSILEH